MVWCRQTLTECSLIYMTPCGVTRLKWVYIVWAKQNGYHFQTTFWCHFSWMKIAIVFSSKFVPGGLVGNKSALVQYRTRISSPLMRAFASHRMRAFASHRIACGEMRACASIRIAWAKCAHMRAFASHAGKCAHMRAFASHARKCAHSHRMRGNARITTRKTRKWDCGNDASPRVLVPDPWNWIVRCIHKYWG